jgi:hypothetical protein
MALLFRWVAKHRHRCPARYPPLDSSSYEQGPHALTHSNPLGKGGLSDEQDRSYCCQEKENAWIPSFSCVSLTCCFKPEQTSGHSNSI